MDAIIYQNTQIDIIDRIKTATQLCRISRFEKMLSDSFENISGSKGLDYIGELNKNDIMP